MVDGEGRACQGPSWQHQIGLLSSNSLNANIVVTSLTSPLSITLQSRVRLSRKLSLVLLARKLANQSLTNLDLNFPRLKADFRLWLTRSSTGSLLLLTSSPTIVQGTSHVDNALHHILIPWTGQKVVPLMLL